MIDSAGALFLMFPIFHPVRTKRLTNNNKEFVGWVVTVANLRYQLQTPPARSVGFEVSGGEGEARGVEIVDYH